MTLEQVARQAGVGIGTLYRHFPSREALVEALYREELEQLSAGVATLLARHRPDLALRGWPGRCGSSWKRARPTAASGPARAPTTW